MPHMMDREFFDWYWQLPPLGGKQNKSLEDTMNKITLIGHLGRDPEMRYTPTGQAVTSFSVATSYGQGDKKQTEWFNSSAQEKSADLCNEYLRKGSEVYIEGRVKARCYEGRDGWQASLDVTVTKCNSWVLLNEVTQKPQMLLAPAEWERLTPAQTQLLPNLLSNLR